jgi:aminoacrylate hydrolase
MKLSVSPPPYEGAPVVVLIAGLGGSGSYWLPQLAALEPEYQVVCYDQRGTGNNPDTLPEGYSLAQMADELAQALAEAGIARYSVVGHALGALVGLQLALDSPDALTALVCVNGWLTLNAHTRRCFQIRERLLHYGGAQAWVEAQPLFLYPADWMAARAPSGGRRSAGAGPFPGQKQPAAPAQRPEKGRLQPPRGAHSLPGTDHLFRRRHAGALCLLV